MSSVHREPKVVLKEIGQRLKTMGVFTAPRGFDCHPLPEFPFMFNGPDSRGPAVSGTAVTDPDDDLDDDDDDDFDSTIDFNTVDISGSLGSLDSSQL